ncbi:MAG TPA: hypothetical protein VGS58_04295, partial [Candidatus Sulfopaludibacter sp.]|nr:hypothetical protein [Candidatus Sulfopaludibacter sp.]
CYILAMKKFVVAMCLFMVLATQAFASHKPVKHPKAAHAQNPYLKHPVKHHVDHPAKHRHHFWPHRHS